MDSKYITTTAQITGPLKAARDLAKRRRVLGVVEQIDENDPPHWLSQGAYWHVEEERARAEFWEEIAALTRDPQP